ncbi:ABC transporter permease [Siculibacillus lacustris]|uniref:ABC transporter permease n=1 Tax=Siculibacillus lacustris TaxID=1549641 RepID=A0A4Q9VJK6_9HYPH|nr:ABC transporter permease [Siculibacillus lacustris]TBW35510.1 ABC transporter permease [Siculibacillus lacustris]
MAESRPETRAIRRLGAGMALLLVGGGLFVPGFASTDNLLDVVTSAGIAGLFALGLLMVLIAGELDISFTAVASIAQFGLALLFTRGDLGWASAILISGGIGLALGLVNAAVVTWLRAPPIITTIALLNVYGGGLALLSRGEMLYDFPVWFSDAAVFRVFGLPVSLQVLLLAVATAATLVLGRTHWGLTLRAAGGNREAALRQGVGGVAVAAFAYGWLGFLSGIAGLAQAQLLQAVTPGSLIGRELDVVAATILGGASLAGGRGSVGGTLLGVLFIALIGNVLVLSGLSPYWHQAVTGTVLIVAVAPFLRGRRRAAIPVGAS